MEQFANLATTTLTGPLSNSTTSVDVTSASLFPNAGNFRILIDSELMIVTGVSGTTFTVTRGTEGTTATTHGTGAVVSQVLTAASLIEGIIENAPAPDLSTVVPYSGANGTVDLNGQTLTNVGTASFAGGNATIDGSGNIGGTDWEIQSSNGQFWLDDGSIYSDGTGGLTVANGTTVSNPYALAVVNHGTTGGTSLDNGTITTDGSGNLIAVTTTSQSIYANQSGTYLATLADVPNTAAGHFYNDNTSNTVFICDNTNAITVSSGASSFAGGNATIDGSGNLVSNGYVNGQTLNTPNATINTDGSTSFASGNFTINSAGGATVTGTNAIVFPGPGPAASSNATVQAGTFNNTNVGGGIYGMSLLCVANYELNWQGGHLSCWNGSSFNPLILDSNLNLSSGVNLTVGGTTSLDNNTITTDGSGNVTTTGSSGGNGPYIYSFTINQGSNPNGALAVVGTTFLDNGAITTDGNGDLLIAGSGNATYANPLGNPALVVLNKTQLDSGGIITDGTGDIIINAQTAGGNLNADGSPGAPGNGYALVVKAGTSLDSGTILTDGSGNVNITSTTSPFSTSGNNWALTVAGGCYLDNGGIMTSGNGCLAVDGTGYYGTSGNSLGTNAFCVSGGPTSLDNGFIFTSGNGGLYFHDVDGNTVISFNDSTATAAWIYYDGSASFASGALQIASNGFITSGSSIQLSGTNPVTLFGGAVGGASNVSSNNWSINGDGSASFANGQATINAIGELSANSLISAGGLSAEGGLVSTDGSGNITANNIPAPPSSDGTYTLQVVVSGGGSSFAYSWA